MYYGNTRFPMLRDTDQMSEFAGYTRALEGALADPGLIPAGTNLNTFEYTATWHQNLSASATLALNYPSAEAGLLEVIRGSTLFLYQRYWTYGPGNTTYTRTRYNSTWYPWKQL